MALSGCGPRVGVSTPLVVIAGFVLIIVGSLFQCRQCQDLLENNLAHKRPIEGVLVVLITGKD